MKILEATFMKDFIRMCSDGFEQGWHERNGGNLSYRMKAVEIAAVQKGFASNAAWQPIGASVPTLGGEHFVVTGSGKYFRNVCLDPTDTTAIIQLDENGEQYRVLWGLVNGGRPTSELPSHLMNHAVKKRTTDDTHRIIYHCHPANLIALTFVLPLEDGVFTRGLWEMATECPVVFPSGVGVVSWMVPGGREIAMETSRLMEQYDVAIWAHHGVFCSGESFDKTFGLAHTVEKSAEILVKVRSMSESKRQTITPEQLRALAVSFHVDLPERFLQ